MTPRMTMTGPTDSETAHLAASITLDQAPALSPAFGASGHASEARTSLAWSDRSCVGGRASTAPPKASVAAASIVAIRSRRLRGGGKYSSSSVTCTISTPSIGAIFEMTDSTSYSGADAPAVTPTIPWRSSGSSSASFTR